jgi:uncharacterized Fe-S cluster-containing MiaB family protein
MGLETMDDRKRIISVNKGSRQTKEQAVGIIRKYQIGARTYVLLKPPFFTEKKE